MCVLAKISSQQGLDCFDDILKEADGIVFDRESITFSVGSEKVFLAQKSIIAKCNRVREIPVFIFFSTIIYMVCSMPNRTDSGLHVSDLLKILKIDRLT